VAATAAAATTTGHHQPGGQRARVAVGDGADVGGATATAAAGVRRSAPGRAAVEARGAPGAGGAVRTDAADLDVQRAPRDHRERAGDLLALPTGAAGAATGR